MDENVIFKMKILFNLKITSEGEILYRVFQKYRQNSAQSHSSLGVHIKYPKPAQTTDYEKSANNKV